MGLISFQNLSTLKENMKTKITARSRHDEYTDEGIKCTLAEKVTKESFTDACDINKIIERIARTGVFPESTQKQYLDVSNIPDYQGALSVVLNAQAQFMSLDAAVRNRFQNDPAQFIEFATNAENQDELIKLGLATKREEKPAIVKPDAKPEVLNEPSA